MFGIGLPEMILILAVALIVVGPDKLPDLARSLAKGILELKKTAEGLKDQLKDDGKLLDDIRPDLEDAAKTFKSHMIEHGDKDKIALFPPDNISAPADNAAKALEELTRAGIAPGNVPADNDSPAKPPAPTQPEDKEDKDSSSAGQKEQRHDSAGESDASRA